MSIHFPLKAIEAIGKLIYAVIDKPLISSVDGVAVSLKLSPDWTILKFPGEQSIIRHDGITSATLTEALVRCYVFDTEAEPTYRVKLVLTKLDPDNTMKTIPVAEYWLGREGHHAWISVQHAEMGQPVRFALPKLDSL